MAVRNTTAGLSGLALYVPPWRVGLVEWCDWTGNDWPRIRDTVGDGFRMPGTDENVYTMAAEAVLRLVTRCDIDPARVGQLVLATESSTDNAVGAVIVRGLVDEALRTRGMPPLASDCEVPEIKQACISGVYGLKQAVRYVQCDGADRLAIVVCADIAEYARGSSGEATQGAGAVAMLVEADARLLRLDLAAGGSASRYRAADFRKPLRRFCGQTPSPLHDRLADFPAFNGKYSTACYSDTMLRAFRCWLQRLPQQPHLDQLSAVHAIFLHRPYAQMPLRALGQVVLDALLHDRGPEDDTVLALCAQAGVDAHALVAEHRAAQELRALADAPLPQEARPLLSRAARSFRDTALYRSLVPPRFGPGAETMRETGNLYTASLPAWIAIGLQAMAQAGDAVGADTPCLLAGYGSGDAAEVLPCRLAPEWARAAAALIDTTTLQAAAIDLDAAQYAALHAGTPPAGLAERPPGRRIRIAALETVDTADTAIARYAVE